MSAENLPAKLAVEILWLCAGISLVEHGHGATSEMPSHAHGMSTEGNHSHAYNNLIGSSRDYVKGGESYDSGRASTHPNSINTSSAGAHSHTIYSTGGGEAHNNMPPYVAVYRWVRTA